MEWCWSKAQNFCCETVHIHACKHHTRRAWKAGDSSIPVTKEENEEEEEGIVVVTQSKARPGYVAFVSEWGHQPSPALHIKPSSSWFRHPVAGFASPNACMLLLVEVVQTDPEQVQAHVKLPRLSPPWDRRSHSWKVCGMAMRACLRNPRSGSLLDSSALLVPSSPCWKIPHQNWVFGVVNSHRLPQHTSKQS